MQYRMLGKDKTKVSAIGLGCMRFPVLDGDNTKIDEVKATQMIHAALESGVNYFDTAYPYHGGTSEGLVGRALGDKRKDVYIADKLPVWLKRTRESMDECLEEQLARLGTDYIDFYLIHALNKKTWEIAKNNDVFGFIKDAMAAGKIRHIGFSFHDILDVFKDIVDDFDWEFCQIQLNFMDEEYQAGLEGMKYAKEKGLDLVIMEPLRGGSLINNMPEDILATWNSAGIDRTPTEWALKYLFNYPEISIVLTGASSLQQLTENINTAKTTMPNSLTDKEKEVINTVKNIYQSRIKVNCTACKYCMPCPAGVDIPQCFKYYNDAFIFQDAKMAKGKYHMFLKFEEEKAANCKKCGLCEKKCPQSIEIIKTLEAVNELFKLEN